MILSPDIVYLSVLFQQLLSLPNTLVMVSYPKHCYNTVKEGTFHGKQTPRAYCRCGLLLSISVQCKFLLCYLILPMTKPRKNKAVTTTIHQIHRINLLSFLILKQYVPEASTQRHD